MLFVRYYIPSRKYTNCFEFDGVFNKKNIKEAVLNQFQIKHRKIITNEWLRSVPDPVAFIAQWKVKKAIFNIFITVYEKISYNFFEMEITANGREQSFKFRMRTNYDVKTKVLDYVKYTYRHFQSPICVSIYSHGNGFDTAHVLTSESKFAEESCPICFGDFKNKLTLRCSHSFCGECFFLCRSAKCALCRQSTVETISFTLHKCHICKIVFSEDSVCLLCQIKN